MLALIGFVIGGLTTWVAFKMISWDKEEIPRK
jgi:hypothetical protein